MVNSPLMYIDEHKFKIDKEVGGPLILNPLGDFEIAEFIKNSRDAILELSRLEPFFLIPTVGDIDGGLVWNQGDSISTHWHVDAGELIILANNFEKNERGSTEWVSNEVLIPAVLSQTDAMLWLKKSAFPYQGMLDNFKQLVLECQSGDRDLINRLLGVLYVDPTVSHEIESILRHIQWESGRHILSCDWSKQDKSTLFVNNVTGFHRGVYNVGKGRPLRRKFI